MPPSESDFWPSDLTSEPVSTPVSILREQAGLLGSKTQNRVRAKVSTQADYLGRFEHVFYLVVPELEDYQYKLFSVSHGIELYPLEIHSEVLEGETGKWGVRVENEQEFLEKIKQVFSADTTKKIVRSLLGQAGWRPVTFPEPPFPNV